MRYEEFGPQTLRVEVYPGKHAIRKMAVKLWICEYRLVHTWGSEVVAGILSFFGCAVRAPQTLRHVDLH